MELQTPVAETAKDTDNLLAWKQINRHKTLLFVA